MLILKLTEVSTLLEFVISVNNTQKQGTRAPFHLAAQLTTVSLDVAYLKRLKL